MSIYYLKRLREQMNNGNYAAIAETCRVLLDREIERMEPAPWTPAMGTQGTETQMPRAKWIAPSLRVQHGMSSVKGREDGTYTAGVEKTNQGGGGIDGDTAVETRGAPSTPISAAASFEERIANEVRDRLHTQLAAKDAEIAKIKQDRDEYQRLYGEQRRRFCVPHWDDMNNGRCPLCERGSLLSRVTTAEFNSEKIAKDWSDDRNANIVEKDHLNTQLAAKYAEIARLKADLSDLRVTNDVHSNRSVAAEKEIARLKRENESLNEAMNLRRVDCDNARASVARLTADRDALKAALDEERKFTARAANLLQRCEAEHPTFNGDISSSIWLTEFARRSASRAKEGGK